MRKMRRKKITPRLCSLGSTVWEQEKHLSNKSTYTIDTRLCNRGSNPAPASSHPVLQPFPALVTDPLVRLAVQSNLYICLYVCVCVIECNQQVSVEWGRNARASHCSALPRVDFPAAALAEASAVYRGPKKIRLRLFSLGASNHIPIPRLLSLSILVSNTINFPLQSRELLHDRIHIAVNSLSLNADRSSHCFRRAALWGFGQLFPFSEFFDNPGQSLIQKAEDLLSWFRIGRYLQCPPQKEPLDTRSATSPTRPSCSQLRTFRRGSQVPPNPSFSSRR